MRFRIFCCIALLTLSTSISMASAGASNSKSTPSHAAHSHVMNTSQPTPCQTSYATYSFLGIGDAGDVAGGEFSGNFGGFDNEACDAGDGIASGRYNKIGYNGSASYSFIGGGEEGQMIGHDSFVGSGFSGIVNADYSAIAVGGYVFDAAQNRIYSNDSFVGGGSINQIMSTAVYAGISGGNANVQTGQFGTVSGGNYDSVAGNFATVPGGYYNEALGLLSFAAGAYGEAMHNGSFVWSDYVSGASPLSDSAADQFVVRASGGTSMYSTDSTPYSGVTLAAGSGTWSSLSDRNAKTGLIPVDDASILAKVASLPVDTWSYKTEDGIHHVGPMAQDFHHAFGIGEDDRHISSIDEAGVALGAIKALRDENGRLRNADNAQRKQILALDSKLTTLESNMMLLRQR